MKEIKEEVKSYNIKYEAIDGTIFYNKEECETYEKSAKAVIRTKFKKLVLDESDEYNLFDMGSDDDTVYVVKMSKPQDADVVKQLYMADNGWFAETEENKRYIDRAFGLIDRAYEEKDILFVGESYDGEIYIKTTRNAFIEHLTSLYNKDEEK